MKKQLIGDVLKSQGIIADNITQGLQDNFYRDRILLDYLIAILDNRQRSAFMDELKSWKEFEMINKDNIKEAFQRMCTYLFCYTYEVEELCEEPNHPGIETCPITYKNKRYGFQCKHFDNKVDYNQIKASVESLLKSKYLNELDFFILYCNKDLSECDSLKEIKDSLSKNNITLIIVSNNEILRLISSNKYYVIYYLFFKRSLIFDNYQFNTIQDSDTDSILRDRFIDIRLNGTKLSEFEVEKITGKVALLEGYAGSGKSVAMYYLYKDMACIDKDDFYRAANLSNAQTLFAYVDFKVYKHNCKNEILSIISEAETCFDTHKIVLFFDGYDEVTDEYAREFASFLSKLSSKSIIERIFISCRSLSMKKHYLVHNLSDFEIYKIDPLTSEDKAEYAQKVLKERFYLFPKIAESDTLIKNVDDPLCLSYVIDNIESVQSSSDIFDLIKLSIEKKIKDSLPVMLEPQILNFFQFIGELALMMYKSNTLDSVTQSDLYELIELFFPKLSYNEMNKIATAIQTAGIVIECDRGIVFKHKRIYEFFLIECIFQKYLADITILDEVNIFKEEDLFENLFLKKLEQNIATTNSLNLIAEYGLFKTYLNENECFGAAENSIMYSDFFVDALGSFDDQTIIDIIDCNSRIKRFFTNSSGKYYPPDDYGNRIIPFFQRIRSSDTLKEYFRGIISKEFHASAEKHIVWLNIVEDNECDFLNKSLEFIRGQSGFAYQYSENFAKIIEIAMNKCSVQNRKELILQLSKEELDCLCKTIFFPNLMVLLHDENVVKAIISQIENLSIESVNSKVFLLYFGSLSKEEEQTLIPIIKKNDSVMGEYNLVFAQIKLKINLPSQIELESVIKDTILLLDNRISCEEYAEEVFKSFEYIRIHNGKFGRQYKISVFAMRFLTSLLTNDEISKRCLKQFIKHKYLNIQLLSSLKKAKPELMCNVVNKRIVSQAINNNLNVDSSIDSIVDTLFQKSFIYSNIDFEKSLYYFYLGYSESVIRLMYHKDSTITPLLVDCYLTVYDNLSVEERKSYLFEIFDMFDWINKLTDDGVYSDSIVSLAQKVFFDSKVDFLAYIDWLRSNAYWEENYETAYNVLFTMINNCADVDYIWEIYNEYVRYRYKNDAARELELRFLLAISNLSEIDSDLNEEADRLIKDGGFEELSVTLSWKEKNLFDILCENNHSVLRTIEGIQPTNEEFQEYTVDIENILWDSDSINYWEQLISRFVSENADLSIILNHLQKSYYPNLYGHHHDNWNKLLFVGLTNEDSREVFYDYFLKNSGYCGFYCLIRAFKDDSEQSVKLYRRYHQFCKLLTRKDNNSAISIR